MAAPSLTRAPHRQNSDGAPTPRPYLSIHPSIYLSIYYLFINLSSMIHLSLASICFYTSGLHLLSLAPPPDASSLAPLHRDRSNTCRPRCASAAFLFRVPPTMAWRAAPVAPRCC